MTERIGTFCEKCRQIICQCDKTMTAKELKSNNRVYKVSLEGNDFIQYEFTEDEFEAFCAQLCKEQREMCFKEIMYQIRDSVVEEKVQQLCENAKMPEL